MHCILSWKTRSRITCTKTLCSRTANQDDFRNIPGLRIRFICTQRFNQCLNLNPIVPILPVSSTRTATAYKRETRTCSQNGVKAKFTKTTAFTKDNFVVAALTGQFLPFIDRAMTISSRYTAMHFIYILWTHTGTLRNPAANELNDKLQGRRQNLRMGRMKSSIFLPQFRGRNSERGRD